MMTIVWRIRNIILGPFAQVSKVKMTWASLAVMKIFIKTTPLIRICRSKVLTKGASKWQRTRGCDQKWSCRAICPFSTGWTSRKTKRIKFASLSSPLWQCNSTCNRNKINRIEMCYITTNREKSIYKKQMTSTLKSNSKWTQNWSQEVTLRIHCWINLGDNWF